MTDWNGHGIDWTAHDRRCATPDYLACGVIFLSVLAGMVVGWCGYAWIMQCP